MKKTLFLWAALCCAVTSWADCVGYGLELPSGTGVNERTIVNIKYNSSTKQLSFTDTYENGFTAYVRTYFIYFYDYDPACQIYVNYDGSYKPVYYGMTCGDMNQVISTSSKAILSNSNGGNVTVDLSSVVSTLISQGHDHVLVGISPEYQLSASASAVKYSTYGDFHSWLMNVAHFHLKSLFNEYVSQVVTPTETINPAVLGSPFEDINHIYLCEGEDTATLSIDFYPQVIPTTSITGIWQTRKDNETQWVETFSPTLHSWNSFIYPVTNGTPMTVENTFSFNASNMPEHSRYFRFGLIWEGDTLFSNEIQIDLKYRIRVTGPVQSKCSNNPIPLWHGGGVVDATTHSFDTISYVVEKQDSIFFQAGQSSCSVVITGSLNQDSPSGVIYATNWAKSELEDVTINDYNIQFFVSGNLYQSYDHVLCSYSPVQCGYTAVTPSNPLFTGKWKDRATGYIETAPWLQGVFDDKIYDAVIAKEYPVEVGGQIVTDLNKEDILGDGGSIMYDPESLKLIIHGSVNITMTNGNAISLLGDEKDHPTFILDISSNDVYLKAPGNGIFVDLANLTIQSPDEYRQLVMETESDAIVVNGALTLLNTNVMAVSDKSSALHLDDTPLMVNNSTLWIISNTDAPTCTGISDLVMKKCMFITPDVKFSAANKTIIDTNTGLPKNGQIRIIPSEDDPEEEAGFFNISNEANSAKRLINGQLYIQREGRIYNAQGAQVK